jgi:hypothetical protein
MANRTHGGFFYSFKWMGISLLIAALIGTAALMEFRAGPIIASLLSLATYGFLAYFLPKRLHRAPTAQPYQLSQAGVEDSRVELLVEAHQHVKALVDARAALPLEVAETVNRLALDAGVIIEAVTAEPEKLAQILRFFTYYLPSTADLVADRIKLAPHAGDARLREIDHTLTRLNEAFAGFKAAVIKPDLASVDIDISLLDDALDADLEDLKTR